jgi:hypothetical protein
VGEFAWDTIKDFYENQGETGIQGSRDSIRMAFKRGLIVEFLKLQETFIVLIEKDQNPFRDD